MDSVEAQAEQGVMYCANHPDRETLLRCNRCNKPICMECAVLTPVGYRCTECVREQQSVFYDNRPMDYPIAAVVSLLLGFAGALGAWLLGWLIIFLAPLAGGLIAETVRWAVRRRRGRYLAVICSAGVVVGAGLVALGFVRGLWGFIWLGVYVVMAVGTILARLR